jgi:glycosyltransferase involved in cell wall biosynthesis
MLFEAISGIVEVIIIDDASVDDTCRVSRAAGAVVIRNEANMGIVKSTEKWLRLATGGIIVTLDADGQHNPSEILVMVQPIIQSVSDLVLGKRDIGIPFQSE